MLRNPPPQIKRTRYAQTAFYLLGPHCFLDFQYFYRQAKITLINGKAFKTTSNCTKVILSGKISLEQITSEINLYLPKV